MNPTPALFSKQCLDEPSGDLVRLHNPSCTLEQYVVLSQSLTTLKSKNQLKHFRCDCVDRYQGGLHCCRSRNILLDADQNPWEDNILTYYMKFRFYFEEYVNATQTKPASHQNLVRMFRETEVTTGTSKFQSTLPNTFDQSFGVCELTYFNLLRHTLVNTML